MTVPKFLDPKNDIASRKVFGAEEHKDILIHFLNDILNTPDSAASKEVEFLSPIQDQDMASKKPSKKQSIVDALCKTHIKLPKFKKDDGSLLSNMVEQWCFFFKHADETSAKDLEQLIGSDLVIERAYDALDRFHWTEQELLAYEQETKRIWDKRAIMAYPFEAGLSKDLERGRAEGRKATQRESAIQLLGSGVAMKIIASSTGLSEDELHKISKTLKD